MPLYTVENLCKCTNCTGTLCSEVCGHSRHIFHNQRLQRALQLASLVFLHQASHCTAQQPTPSQCNMQHGVPMVSGFSHTWSSHSNDWTLSLPYLAEWTIEARLWIRVVNLTQSKSFLHANNVSARCDRSKKFDNLQKVDHFYWLASPTPNPCVVCWVFFCSITVSGMCLL